MAKNKVTLSHVLIGCRLDNWIRLRRQNTISPEHKKQARFMTFIITVMGIPAFFEWLLYKGRINRTELKKDPIYIVGHWRTGTTYLQNLFTRDPQFAWFDPLKTITINNCILLKPVIRPLIGKFIKGTRAMDNLEYDLNLPMEEVFAQATLSDQAVAHMLVFPGKGEGIKYVDSAFTDEQSPEKQDDWLKDYKYILKKVTYLSQGKQLLLKSPENTCRIAFLKKNFPGAKFINIYRNPYKVIMSTINMYHKEMGIFGLNEAPSDEVIEDTIIELFARIYRKAFKELYALPEEDRIDICYEDFCKAPMEYTKQIYGHLGIGGFDAAYPYLKAYIDDQEGYQTNKFTLDDELKEKINSRLGFYFEKYGYEML